MELHCDEKSFGYNFQPWGKKILVIIYSWGQNFWSQACQIGCEKVRRRTYLHSMYTCGQKNSNKKRSKMNFSIKCVTKLNFIGLAFIFWIKFK